MKSAGSNKFKRALASGGVQLGLWQALSSPYTAEICAVAGFDWMLFDGEHSPSDVASLLTQLQATAPYPSNAVGRVPVGEAWIIKQYLDIGFQTLLIPFVDSAEKASELARAVRYPPSGIRGVAPGLSRAARWGAVPSYLDIADQEVCLLAQIETADGLAALEQIADVEGIDGIFIGPADLSAAFGHRGNPGHPEMVDRIGDALRRIVRTGKAAGTLALTPTAFAQAIDCGAKFVAVGTDVGLLATGAAALLERYRKSDRLGGQAAPTGY